MSDLAEGARQEFWRPPQAQPAVQATLPDACRRCGTEFMVGAAFCHICGMGRHRSAATATTSWARYLAVMQNIDFARVHRWFGLPLASLCAFLTGGLFLLIALAQGLHSAQEFSDVEVIQLWRIQWLMAACAAFLAAILLKSSKSAN